MSTPKSFSPPPSDQRLLVIEEVCRLTGYSISGLYVNRNRGLSPGNLAVYWKGRLYWRAADLERWMAERLSENFERRWAERNKPTSYYRKESGPVTTHARQLANAKKAGNE